MRTNIEKLQMNNTNPLKTEGNLGSFNKAAVPALYDTHRVTHAGKSRKRGKRYYNIGVGIEPITIAKNYVSYVLYLSLDIL